MATFDFSQANGTTLETIDALWAGNSTLIETNSGRGRVTSTGGGTPRIVRYENGQGGTQASQGQFIAGAGTVRVSTQVHSTQVGYEARAAGTNTLELRRNGTYVNEGNISGGNFTTTDYTIKVKSNSATGSVQIYAANGLVADAEVSGSLITSTTDGTPLTSGFPGFSLQSTTSVDEARIEEWTDFVSAGGSSILKQVTQHYYG